LASRRKRFASGGPHDEVLADERAVVNYSVPQRAIDPLQPGHVVVVDAELGNRVRGQAVRDAVAQAAAELESEQVVVERSQVVELLRIAVDAIAGWIAGELPPLAEIDVPQAGHVAEAPGRTGAAIAAAAHAATERPAV